MNTIRVLIVDDEPLAREGVRLLLAQDPAIEVVAEAANGKQAVAAIEEHAPDLVFLDIQMPGMTGLQVLENIDVQRAPEIVFVTAYDQYALQAFEHHALDYLLKPFDDERFFKALERVKQRIRQQGADRMSQQLVALLTEYRGTAMGSGFTKRLAVRSGGRIYFLRSEEIDWIEAADYYVKLHVGDKAHLMRESMNKLEEQLDPETFLRVHRSAIVNLDRVKELRTGGAAGDPMVVLRDGTRLKLSRSRREKLNALLDRRG